MRLIDADAIQYWQDDSGLKSMDYVRRSQIDSMPTIAEIDLTLVGIVYCKDCKHYQAQDPTRPTTCAVGLEDNLADDFCSRGERRADATD